MASAILIFCAICFILVQINFANGINNGLPALYNNATNVHSPSESGRSKRALVDEMPNKLKIDVYTSQKLKSMIWRKINGNFLANEYLPVDIPLDEKDRVDNVMKNVGDFVLYRDYEENSALIYFGKTKTFFGVIGADYYIQNLPYNFDENKKYRVALTENEHLKKREGPLFPNLPQIGFPTTSDTNIGETSNSNQNRKRPADSEAGPSNKPQCIETNRDDDYLPERVVEFGKDRSNIRNRRDHRKIKKYFLESLIFVCRDIVDIFKKDYGDDYLEWIVKDFIVHFNAVDTMFRKIPNPHSKLSINIARIVIEDNLIPFTFINDGQVQYSEIVSELPKYLEINSFDYPPDSFDHVFIFTSRTILNKASPILVATKHGVDLSEARKNNKNFYEVVPISVMTFKLHYANYLLTIQEIGRVLRLDNNPLDEFLELNHQCCGFDQARKLQCHICLQWSANSLSQFDEFFRENPNRCFLLNEPRSIQPPGIVKLLTVIAHCRCFGYHYYENDYTTITNRIQSLACNDPVECTKIDGGKIYSGLTVRPFDGTPCLGARKSVCWRGICKRISSR